jgi:hypothetical protein
MADIAQANPVIAQSQSKKFSGSSRNLVPGLALIVAGLIAPVMGLTDVYFAGALAWVFVIWGALLVYADLMAIYETYEVTDDELIIKNYYRFWEPTKRWAWDRIVRVDVVVNRSDGGHEDAELRVYYDVPDEGNVEREDRDYNPELTALVLVDAGLAAAGHEVEDLSNLPGAKAVYTWN